MMEDHMHRLLFAFVLAVPLHGFAQGLVEIDNVPLPVRNEAIYAGDLLAREVRVTNGSQTMVFNESVELLDVSVAPVPPNTTTISGICQVRLLINDVPLKIAGYTQAARLRYDSKSPEKPPLNPIPWGIIGTATLANFFGYGAGVVPGRVLNVSPNDVIRLETVSLPQDLDCTADFIVVATPASIPPSNDDP
jgi:hypothetical protein